MRTFLFLSLSLVIGCGPDRRGAVRQEGNDLRYLNEAKHVSTEDVARLMAKLEDTLKANTENVAKSTKLLNLAYKAVQDRDDALQSTRVRVLKFFRNGNDGSLMNDLLLEQEVLDKQLDNLKPDTTLEEFFSRPVLGSR